MEGREVPAEIEAEIARGRNNRASGDAAICRRA
jgi:hypothetical protein